jgi:monoamine oxidase
MSHTPLVHWLRRVASEARAARSLGLTLDQLRDARASSAPPSRPTRREIVVGAAAAAGALALPRTARASSSNATVAIVGAGISGLAAALRLRDRGIESTVYESSGRAGGRMFTLANGDWDHGQTSEWCGELIDTGHRTIRRLAKRFRLKLVNLPNAEPNGSNDTFFFDGTYYSHAQAEHDFAAIVPALDADLAAAGYPTTFDAYTPGGFALGILPNAAESSPRFTPARCARAAEPRSRSRCGARSHPARAMRSRRAPRTKPRAASSRGVLRARRSKPSCRARST